MPQYYVFCLIPISEFLNTVEKVAIAKNIARFSI